MASTKDTLLSLHLDKFSGKITLQRESIVKIVYLKKGAPIYVESSVRSETLGQMLLEKGKLNDSQYRMVLDKMQSTGHRQGDCIVELGYMSGFDVYEALKDQMAKKFQNLFLLEDPEITAEEGDKFLMGVQEFPIDFFRTLLDVAYAMVSDVDSSLYQPAEALLITPEGSVYLQSRGLHVKEMRVVRMCDGRTTWGAFLKTYENEPELLGAMITTLREFKFLVSTSPLPKAFKRTASAIAQEGTAPPPKEASVSGGRVVEITDTAAPKHTSPIFALALRLDQPLHKLLSLPQQMNRFQVKKAYEQTVRDLHLDSIADHYQDEERRLAEAIFDRVTLAYAVLQDDKRRQEYLQSLAERKPETAGQNPKIQAEVAAQRAQMQIVRRKYADAETDLRKAIAIDAQESSYHVELASLLMIKAASAKEGIPDIVEQEIKAAIKINPQNVEAFFQYGMYYHLKGDEEKARNAFMRTVDLQPNHAKASAELRLINKRMEQGKSGSPVVNFFKKLTDKKDAGPKKGTEGKKKPGPQKDQG